MTQVIKPSGVAYTLSHLSYQIQPGTLSFGAICSIIHSQCRLDQQYSRNSKMFNRFFTKNEIKN